jgi:hypothetical protein
VTETDVRPQLGLATNRKVLVAYTSSLDELIASGTGVQALGIPIPDRPQPFADQIEWLTALTNYVERSDDLQLVVRIHPREGINKRESIRSQHYARLRDAFSGSYAHCRFVWPEDRVSSYDLAEAADLIVTSWTTIGLEMARLGAPVLVAFNGAAVAMPCDDFLEWAPRPEEYFEKLRSLLDRPASLETIARAFRWYNLYNLGITVDLTDLIPRSDFAGLPPFKMPREAAMIEEIMIGGKDVCDINVERLHHQPPGSRTREFAELRRQLRRLVHFLMTGEDSTHDAPFAVVTGPAAETVAGAATANGARFAGRVLCVVRKSAEYHESDRVFRRYSPMAVRLARVCADEFHEAATAGALR